MKTNEALFAKLILRRTLYTYNYVQELRVLICTKLNLNKKTQNKIIWRAFLGYCYFM